MNPLTQDELQRLTVKELKACARCRLTIPKDVPSRKETLVMHILRNTSEDMTVEVRKVLWAKSRNQAGGSKRRGEEEHHVVPARNPPHIADDHDTNQYLDLPMQVEVKALYKEFYDATSSKAVKRTVCGICARECGKKDGVVEVVDIEQVYGGLFWTQMLSLLTLQGEHQCSLMIINAH